MAELEVRLLESMRGVPREAWDGLLAKDASPFVEWAFLDALEEAGCVGGETGWIPRHLAVYRKGELIAAAPSYVKTNSEGEFVFDWAWADLAHRMGLDYYPKVVVGVPFTPVTGDRALVAPGEDRGEMIAVLAHGLRAWAKTIDASSVHVLFAGAAENALWTRVGFAERLGYQFHWKNDGYATVDDFLARFNSKRRNQIKREMAQPGKDGVTIRTLAEHELTPAVRDAMFAFYLTTVDKFVYGRRYLNRGFFDLMVERFGARLAWVMAKDAEGTPIAGAFNVQKGARLYGRYWGATRELPFLHFNVCYYHGIGDAISRGLEAFEPGAGGEHKYVRGFEPTLTYSAHHIAHPKLSGVIRSFVAREAEAVREHVEKEKGEGPLKPVAL